MGANQALESGTSLANDLLGTDQWTMDNIMAAMERYTQARRGRAAGAIKKAVLSFRAQLCCPGYEDTVEAMPRRKFAVWIIRALIGLREAPVLESLPLTERGQYYGDKVGKFFERLGQAEKAKSLDRATRSSGRCSGAGKQKGLDDRCTAVHRSNVLTGEADCLGELKIQRNWEGKLEGGRSWP